MSFDRLPPANDRRLAQSSRDPFLGNFADRLPAIRVSPCPNLVEPIRPRVDLAHGVYFCSGSSKYSFSGHVDSQVCIQEKEIIEFVRHSHPNLYKKLDKMVLESSHLSGDSKDASGAIDGCSDLSCDSSPETTSILSDAEYGVVSPANKAEPMEIDCPSEPDDMPQAQEDFLSAINSQQPVHLHCQPGVVFYCGAASCGFRRNVIPEGSLFTLVNGAYYCLNCASNL